MMLEQIVRRIPITSGGRVVGIVSASDVVQLFVNLYERPREPRELAASARRRTVKGRL